MTDLKDCIAALKAEILELRSTVQELSSKVEAAEIENRKAEPSWSHVVRRGKKRQQKQRQEPQPARQTLDPTRQGDKTRKSVKAVGARKIWGTLKTTTSAAVKNALSSLTKVSCSDLQIKRKYKSSRRNPDTVAKWWFVIRGEENKLQELEGEWRAIAIQTAWKLEPVYYYEENTISDADNDSESAVVNGGESTPVYHSESTPVNDSSLSHNATLSFLDKQ